MYIAISEEDIYCAECVHDIPAGSVCLSQMPEVMPDGFRRKKYDNFCVSCAKCDSKSKPPCYARRLDHWYFPKEETKESAPCGYCGNVVPKGARTAAQKIYAWRESESENVQDDGADDATIGPAASGGVAASAAGGVNPGAGAWHNLSPALRRRFITGGLRGRGLGYRTPAMAQRLYENEVPLAVRNLGEDAVRNFLNGKQFSHIKSVANAPGQARLPSNIVLEDGVKNMARGSRNMTASEIAAVKSAGRASALKMGAKSAVKGGAKAGAVAAAIEFPISAIENSLHWKRGRKSGMRAVKDTAKDTGVAAGVGVAAAGIAKGAAIAGVGVSLGPFGTPLMVAGGGLMVAATAHRLIKAGRRDLPLDVGYIHFCNDKSKGCKTKFAEEITKAARDC